MAVMPFGFVTKWGVDAVESLVTGEKADIELDDVNPVRSFLDFMKIRRGEKNTDTVMDRARTVEDILDTVANPGEAVDDVVKSILPLVIVLGVIFVATQNTRSQNISSGFSFAGKTAPYALDFANKQSARAADAAVLATLMG
jgi:hypothetical protein